MDANNRLFVKLIHCGNINIANPLDRGQKSMFLMPMGLFPLADVLRKNHVEVEIIHLDLESGKPLEEILDFNTLDAVGLDCHWVNQGLVVMETAQLIKKIKPGVFIFLGGFTASLFANEIITNFPQIDAVIRGDGEIPIVELCKALHEEKKNKSPRRPDNVQNLVWRKDKKIRVNDFSYVGTNEEMERLDFAAVDLLRNWESYRNTCTYFSHFEPFCSTPVFYLETGRGCQYACVFCGGNCAAQKKMNNREHTVMRSIDSVIGTIKKAVTRGYRTLYTCMESESSDNWYIELFNRMKKENIKINYCYGSWGLPSKALIDALSQSCNRVLFEISPETSNNSLRGKNKDPRLFYSTEQLEECLEFISKKTDIKVQLYFGYYLASDTKKTILDTLYFALELLIKYHRFLEIDYHNFSTDPGSLFFFYPGKFDLQMKPRNFKDYLKYLRENYQEKEGQLPDMTLFLPKSISKEEDAAIRRKMRLLNYSFSSYTKSISYILEKTGTPDIIMEFLEGSEIPVTAGSIFSPQLVRDALIEACKRKNILDLYLYKILWFEFEKQKSISREPKAATHIYLDFAREEKIAVELEAGENGNLELLEPRDNITDEEEFEF